MPKRVTSDDDVKLINDAFSVSGEAQVLEKNADGVIIKPKKEIVNLQGYSIKSFMGRTLKWNKSYKKTGKPQILVAKKGQKYEDVPEHLRSLVKWSEADFI